jgi:5-methyltetrahydropteroyltriglutamate--homocysteine methyltransferase
VELAELELAARMFAAGLFRAISSVSARSCSRERKATTEANARVIPYPRARPRRVSALRRLCTEILMSVIASNLGFPRIGPNRELKKALEAYWSGRSSKHELLKAGAELRARNWLAQQKWGLEHIPSNDFSLYDHVLDLSCLVGCIPARYGWSGGSIDLDTYFAMARGRQTGRDDVTAMEMTKWFDTNYHYLVPEFEAEQSFRVSSTKIFDAYQEAKTLGVETRPVLVGPLTYVTVGKKRTGANYCRSTLIAKLVPVYIEVLQKLRDMGAQWVQIDEPALALDLRQQYRDACLAAYRQVAVAVPDLKILLATYFDSLRDNAELAFSLPVAGLHIDLCRGPGQAHTSANDPDRILQEALSLTGRKYLSLGIVDGRNIWKNDLSASLAWVEKAIARLGADQVIVAPSCSLLHVPVDLTQEDRLDPAIRNWMAFATQKVEELVILTKGANLGRKSILAALEASDGVRRERKRSTRIHDGAVQRRIASISADMKTRHSSFAQRQTLQRSVFALPAFPTTTIGSFPQTVQIRQARAAFKKGEIDAAAYQAAMQAEIKAAVTCQLRIGLDVLVHGEPERNDMVEYFGEQLSGFAFTQNGWVQSYGSRCVKPPVIFGDISRPRPMTVEWATYAQSLTDKIMKGMLTGPITILQWSFVRDDQPREVTALQIALAIRDEVSDLERAGIRIIQIDEAALREGLPLRRADWKQYLDHAVEDFRIASSAVQDRTSIHTHMCYSDFNDIMPSIAAMDADVISIETSRSQMELLNAFVEFRYPNEIGPGVYDIHSPRVPTTEEMVTLLRKAGQVLKADQIWVNPDCGLKTRGWPEVEQALINMVAAARTVRQELLRASA